MYSNELICNILNYLDNNINSDISIDLISSIFCYDKFYIMKRFKKEIGLSIFNYINSTKIYNSLKYYRNNDSILKIAFDSGFNSLEYYSEIFKKIIGVSPLDYKKFINFDIRLSEKDSNIIIDSLINLESLKNYCSVYRQRVKPKDNMIKKLSIFK
jgi:AraC-like DNA-binding protein